MAKMTLKHKLMAYVLTQDADFSYSQNEVAKLLNISQSRISESVKDIKYQMTIRNLEKEIENTKNKLMQHEAISLNEPEIYFLNS